MCVSTLPKAKQEVNNAGVVCSQVCDAEVDGVSAHCPLMLPRGRV